MYAYKAEGIVIRNYDYGEGHRTVVLFTREFGKIKAVAKGSRKVKSRFGASLEPLSENHFTLYRKPAQELYVITGSAVLEPHSSLRKDMRLFAYASVILETLDILQAEEDPDTQIYSMLRQALADIGKNNPAPSAWLAVFRLLKYSGYRLDFFKCVSCGGRDIGNAVFSPGEGGMVCGNCRAGSKSGWKISGAALSAIKKLSPQAEIDRKTDEEIGNIIVKYIKYQFDKDMKSMKFLKLFGRPVGDKSNVKRIS